MLSASHSFLRSQVQRVDKARVINISGDDWFGTNKDGRGILISTGSERAPSPPDYMLMALAACSGDDVKYVLEQNNRRVSKVKVDVEADYSSRPPRRFTDIRLKYTVVSPDHVSQEDVDRVADAALAKLCPVANTINGKPTISTTVKVINKE